ncbi:GIY-YIG nuclease family protein [Bacteroidia bacterium]|nr:GIY-YIG nuclease family protein [Bacteroidia bacterium]
MATVYIIHSKATDNFYVGSSADFEMQLEQHRKGHFPKGYKSEATDWASFFTIDDLDIDTARRIEKHFKKMKSREYFDSLKEGPGITARLIEEFSCHRNR